MLRRRLHRLLLLPRQDQWTKPRASSRHQSSHTVLCAASGFHTQGPPSSSAPPPLPPNAPPRPRRGPGADAYAWMEEPGSAEMLAHLDAENRYTYRAMESTHRLQATLFREMYAYLRPSSTDTEKGDALRLAQAGGDGYVYYSCRPLGVNFPIYYRRRHRPAATGAAAAAAADAPSTSSSPSKEETEQILLDQNAMPVFYQRQHLGDLKVSPPNDDDDGRRSSSSSSSTLVAFTLAAPEAMEQGTTLYIHVLDDNPLIPSSSPSASSSFPSWWTADQGAWQGIGSFEWGPSQNTHYTTTTTNQTTDTRILYYTKVDIHGRPHQVWMVRVKGDGQGLHDAPQLLFTLPKEDEAFFLSLGATKDHKFVTISANSKTASEVYLLPGSVAREGAREGGVEPVLFRRRRAGVQYFVDHGGGQFFVVTNEKEELKQGGGGGGGGKEKEDGSGEYRLVACPAHDTSRWTPYVEEGNDSASSGSSSSSSSSIEDMDLFHQHCVLYERVCGVPSLRVLDRHPHSSSSSSFLSSHRPPLPREVDTGRLQPGLNQDYFSHTLRFSLTSPILPDVTYEYDMQQRQLTELHREILRGRSPFKGEEQQQDQQQEHYECHRQWVQSNDNQVQIPLTLAHKRGLVGPAPVLLLAYGAYGVSLDLSFRPEILPLMDRGWVVAYAHVRGGGELGRRWHALGKGARKMNSVSDYLACAQWLIEEKWTQPGLLVGQGASAGALVVAGGVHRSPNMFGAMVLKVPFLDLARTMIDPSLPLTVHEYDEWTDGQDPRRDAEVQARLRELSPYDSLDLLLPSSSSSSGAAVTAGRSTLPPTLLLASLVDHRVHYWEAAKYAAKAREVNEGRKGSEVLLRMEGDRAHEAPAAQTDVLQEAVYEAAFMITRLRLKEQEGGEEEVVEDEKKEGGRAGRRRARRAAHEKPRHLGKVPPLVFW